MKNFLFKPFERYSGIPLLLVGLGITVFGVFMSFAFNTRFDGVLDFHAVESISLQQALKESIINIASLFLFLYLAAVLVYKRTRPIDLLNTVLVARAPMYILPLLNINNYMTEAANGFISATKNVDNGTQELLDHLPFFLITVIVLLAAIIWSVALLVNGYRTASNAKSTSSIVYFIIALLLAEILSKVLIHFFK